MNLSLACGLLLTLYVSTSSPVSTGKYLLVKLTGPGQAAVRSFGPGVNHREDSLRNGVEGPGSSGTLPRRQLRAGKRNRGAQGYGGGAGKPRGPPPADKDEMKSDEDVTIPGVSKEEDSESSSSLSQEETESRNGQGSSSTGSTKEEIPNEGPKGSRPGKKHKLHKKYRWIGSRRVVPAAYVHTGGNLAMHGQDAYYNAGW